MVLKHYTAKWHTTGFKKKYYFTTFQLVTICITVYFRQKQHAPLEAKLHKLSLLAKSEYMYDSHRIFCILNNVSVLKF